MQKAKIESLFIKADIEIKAAMQRLNETAEKILLVVDERKCLIGTITDGDIRRSLIHGAKFNHRIDDVMAKKFSAVPDNDPDKIEKAKLIMLDRSIEQIPFLDISGRVTDVVMWADIFGEKGALGQKNNFTTPVIIMAGGKGTRLDPVTRILPKPLIPVGEKPIIEIIMDKFYKSGFSRFILTLNYKKEYIKMFIKENRFPYNIECVEENNYSGTAGSLSLLSDRLKETFIVSNCDVIVNADYGDVIKWHKDHGNLITLIGCHKEIEIPYGILEMEKGRLTKFTEKPNHDVIINTGVYVIEPEVLSMIASDEVLDMNVFIQHVAKKGKVSVYPIQSGWLDIGQWEEYKKSIKELGGQA